MQERKPRFTSLSGLDINRVYSRDDLKDWSPEGDLGAPGEFPYTRGVYPTMYRGQFWTMRQFAGFGSAADTNRRFKYLLQHGQTGLSVAFDMPTLMGIDADDVSRPWRGRSLWRRDLIAGRYGSALRGHSARPGHDVDDDQWTGRRDLRHVPGCCGKAWHLR